MSENNNEEIKVEEKEVKEQAEGVEGEGEKKGPSKAAKKRAKKKAAKQKKKDQSESVEIVELQDIISEGLKIEIKPKALDSVKEDFDEGKEIDYKFWKDQPVPQFNEQITEENCAYDEPKPLNEVQQEPYKLDAKLDWSVVDIFNATQMDEVYTLLNRNYVEDDDNMFRFDYSREFLKWALSPPGWRQDWHIGIRHKDNNLLVGFISAIPANLRVYNKNIPLVEINFLCVHKKLREKRIAPILIQEITRRVHLTNRWQAVYTAGRLLPRPVSICRYYHRSLNPKKLISVGFSHLGPKKTMSMAIKLYKLPDAPKVAGIRAFTAKDVPAVGDLIRNYLNNFKIAPVFTNEEVSHWLIPRDMVINAYVVEDPNTHAITDFVSFYTLPSTIVNHEKYNTLKAAYSFYNVSTKTPWVELMNDALIFAKNLEFDVFNCLDAMENSKFLKELKFGIGDGKLHYYLYNWKCPTIAPEDLGLVLM